MRQALIGCFILLLAFAGSATGAPSRPEVLAKAASMAAACTDDMPNSRDTAQKLNGMGFGSAEAEARALTGTRLQHSDAKSLQTGEGFEHAWIDASKDGPITLAIASNTNLHQFIGRAILARAAQ